MEKKAINLCDKIREEELEIPQSFDLSVKHLYDLQNNVPDKYDKICLAFKFGYMQAQRAEKVNKTKEENNQLPSLLSQLRPEDYRIKRQIEAIYTGIWRNGTGCQMQSSMIARNQLCE